MHPMTTAPEHSLATDPALPHPFKAPPADWASIATIGPDADPTLKHIHIAGPRLGHPPRCRVLGCARPSDDPVHDLR